MAILNNNPLIGSGGNQGYNINNSLRFRSSASAYLNRTPASAGNRRTYTFSAWIKRGSLSTNSDIFNVRIDGDNQFRFYFNSSDQIDVYNQISGTIGARLITTAVYRDPSAWYHIVLAIDTTNATAGNRMRLYVNESEVNVFGTDTQPSQNYDNQINTTNLHSIGNFSGSYFDGYMADINFIDGQQLTPSSFGETDTTTGVWKPKAYSGTYGTNGFYLKFSDIATTSGSNAGLGKDFSGNTNYWTTNNISVTSGTTYDAMTDSPTNTSATVANYCTLNPLSNLDATTLAAANLNFTQTTGSSSVFGTMGVSSGKWYWEVICQQGVMAGVADTQRSGGTYPGAFANSCAWDTFYTLNSTNTHATGTFTKAGTISGSAGTAGQVIGVALDMDAGTIVYYINGSVQNSGNAVFTNITGTVFPVFRGSTTTSSVNFGQRPFAYTPPTGFVALNTYNLPDSTIKKGNKYMDATLYTGTGATQAVTNSGSMKPDLVWLKSRGVARDHRLMDTVRGINLGLQSDLTDAEYTGTALSSINSNGFTLNTTDNQNVSSEAYVAWQWQAGQGTNTTNTSGSITSTVSVNTTAGFSVVTYTGNGSSGNIGHGLGVAPKIVLVKNRTTGATQWVFFTSIVDGSWDYLLFNSTAAKGDAGETAPTSTTFNVASSSSNINTNGDNYVAYCWAEIAGFSKFGSYTGNANADGPFIYTGFRPKFVMFKRTDSTGSWEIQDTSRSDYNVISRELYANLSDAEYDDIYNNSDFLSNGFKMRSGASSTNNNPSGGTVIYMAFAENPFKNALAR